MYYNSKQNITTKHIVQYKNKVLDNLLNWFTFLFSFPVILILGQNASFYLFIILLLKLPPKIKAFSIKNKISILPILFAIGAIISVLDINSINNNSLSNSLVVLPNYIYWSLLVIVLINIKDLINVKKISQYIMFGVIATIIYYNIQSLFSGLNFIFNKLTPNSFSFILICFSAPSFIYLLTIKKNKLAAFLFLIISVLYLISEGRRAGTMLVLLPCIFAFLFSKIEIKKIGIGLLTFIFMFGIMQTEFVEKSIESLNPRIYSLLYESENITSEDRSFLVRRLQVEKALIVFSENPLTGIGLNNFSNYSVDLVGDFKGSEFVVNKKGMNDKSAHNSYISLLAEGGILLLGPLLLLFVFNILQFIKKYNNRTQIENAYYWSFLAMCIHLYFITGIVNVYAWFLIGIVTMLSVKYQYLKLMQNPNWVKKIRN